MSAPTSGSRQASFNSRRRSRLSVGSDDSPDLQLTPTRSHDISVGESIAVYDAADPEIRKTGVDDSEIAVTEANWPQSIRYLIYFCAFLASLSFGVTQVPMLYVFRLMTCDIYYENHPGEALSHRFPAKQYITMETFVSYVLTSVSPLGRTDPVDNFDRCSNRSIDSSTALSITLLGASTTVFGIMNLFITGNLIKIIGLKRTLMIQVGFPAVRLLIQNIGIEVWGQTGIIIVQCSQIASVLGGPSGYILVLNAFITEVVDYEERTAGLGRVAGSMFAGSATGFLVGGVLAEERGIKIPYRVTLVLFLVTCAYVGVFFPHIPPAGTDTAEEGSDSKPKQSSLKGFLAPLLVFTPRKFVTRDGIVQKEYGTFLVACGVFLGILATGYLPNLLQLYSTDVFNFGTEANGWLIFIFSLLRGIFLTFAFPRIIALGRRMTAHMDEKQAESTDPGSSETEPLLSTNTNPIDANNPKPEQKKQTFKFDLIYTRSSLLADGILTLSCSLVHRGWQMYVVAAILPFSAGTGSAAKGTVLQMAGSHATSNERTDALAGLSLVENMARLTTSFVFGVVFAAFASIGRLELVFTCNAAVAVVGFVILFLARFPPEGSHPLGREEESTRRDT